MNTRNAPTRTRAIAPTIQRGDDMRNEYDACEALHARAHQFNQARVDEPIDANESFDFGLSIDYTY